MLFLQGAAGPCFAAVGAALAARGYQVHRVNFNAGDRLDWTLPNAVDFRERPGAWPDFLDRLLRARRITDILLFGDCRPLHQAAIKIAQCRGVRVHVLEEGYARPGWVTFELNGVNGHSTLPRDPQWYLDQAARLPALSLLLDARNETAYAARVSFARRASAAIGYHVAAIVGAAAYPFYRTHRPWHPLAEAAGWVRRLSGTYRERRRSLRALASLRDHNQPYFLFPLQLDSDFQLRVHSPFGGLAPAIDCVFRSFAAHAPARTLIVVKQHPLENGLQDWRSHVAALAASLGVADRTVFVEAAGLVPLASYARGLVTVNSTSAMAALSRSIPVAALGSAVFALPGLIWAGSLDRFWGEASPPDRRLFDAFCRVLQHRCLLRGDFLTHAGVKVLARGIVARLEDGAPPLCLPETTRARVGCRHAGGRGMTDLPANIILDVSRLLLRAVQPAPTGIDRVELAYAQYLITHQVDRLRFAAIHPVGHLALLPKRAVQRFILAVGQHWEGAASTVARPLVQAQLLLHGTLLHRSPVDLQRSGRAGDIYLNVSHHHLNRPHAVQQLKRHGARVVCLVHDLIPIQLPEYVRPRAAERHRRRIDTVARLSDAVIVNSNATRHSLMPYLERAGRSPPVVVAQLGVPRLPPMPARVDTARPYFVCLGTIEPRKNHLLLLNLWRRFAADLGGAAPRLVLAGRRGWENENILDMIERCSALRGVVEERTDLRDAPMREILHGARALLFPSFAEGYGLPLAEALSLGAPVLCSNLPVLREVGGAVPEYLDPLDGIGWKNAILDYARPDSQRRAAQLTRLAQWRAPSWDRHMRSAIELIDGPLASLAASPPYSAPRERAGQWWPPNRYLFHQPA